jgi:hypothetical protein
MPLPVRELIAIALEHPDTCYDAEKHQPKDVLINHYAAKLESKADMLEDFFAIKLTKDLENKEETKS